MKTFISILFLFLSLQGFTQKKISTEDWQSDLRFLQETVHESFPFLFKKIKAKDFDAKVEQLYKEIPKLEDYQIVVEFTKLVAAFEYGHTFLDHGNSSVTFHNIPIQIYEFTDGVFITGAHKDLSDILGAKILEVEGKPIKEVFKAIYPTVSAENEYFFKSYGISNALVPEILHTQEVTNELKRTVTLTLEKEGSTFKRTIQASKNIAKPIRYGEVIEGKEWLSVRNQKKSPLYLKNLEKRYFYEYLPKEKAVYVRYSQVMDDKTEKIQPFFNRVFDFIKQNEVEKFILDVRLNSGGNNYNNKKVLLKIIQNKKINQKGKFFVVIGRRTFSAAQNLINEIDNYTNVTFVGEPSAENINFYGDSKRMRLPKSALNAYLSFAWWQDKPQWENADYTRPDALIKLSYQEYVSNQDPIMMKILYD